VSEGEAVLRVSHAQALWGNVLAGTRAE